jgi:hypothetical protein
MSFWNNHEKMSPPRPMLRNRFTLSNRYPNTPRLAAFGGSCSGTSVPEQPHSNTVAGKATWVWQGKRRGKSP